MVRLIFLLCKIEFQIVAETVWVNEEAALDSGFRNRYLFFPDSFLGGQRWNFFSGITETRLVDILPMTQYRVMLHRIEVILP